MIGSVVGIADLSLARILVGSTVCSLMFGVWIERSNSVSALGRLRVLSLVLPSEPPEMGGWRFQRIRRLGGAFQPCLPRV
jgi:hypothetical protein